MHYLDPPFSVNTTATDSPLIAFAIKEHSSYQYCKKKKKRKEKKHTGMKLFKFHIDCFLDIAKGMV